MSFAPEEYLLDPNQAMEKKNPPNIGQSNSYRICRLGARPIRFIGSEIAMAMSYTPGVPYWYEINIYRSVESDFVLAIRLFHVSEDLKDTVEAWQFGSLDEVLGQIESYDAASDIAVDMDQNTFDSSVAEATARALQITATIESARRHYRGLAGEMLHEIDAS